MAAGASLKITYNTSDGTTIHTWKYADSDATQTDVQNLVTVTLTNATMFRRVPLSVKEAKMVVTTETPITVS